VIEAMSNSNLTANPIAEAADNRRSVRKFTSEPIPQRDLRELVRLAGRAPSAFNVQPWRFVVVTDPALKERLREAAYGQPQVTGAPAVLVLYSDMRDAIDTIDEAIHPDVQGEKREAQKKSLLGSFAKRDDEDRETWGAQQSNIALGYLLLAAEGMGLGTSPMLGFQPEKVKEVLDLPANVRIPAMIALGYPAEEGFRSHRHEVERIVTFR
jgi:nitroreductase